jgi:hypothetical protein
VLNWTEVIVFVPVVTLQCTASFQIIVTTDRSVYLVCVNSSVYCNNCVQVECRNNVASTEFYHSPRGYGNNSKRNWEMWWGITSKRLLLPINKATERAAMYTVKSRSSILRIRRKHRERNATNPTQLLKSPGKKAWKRSRNVVFVDDFDTCVIRNAIQDFYIQEKSVNNNKAAAIIKKKIHFHWGRK